MKIEAGRGVSANSPARKAGAAAAPGFTIAADSVQRAAAAAATVAVAPLDAMLALQAEEPGSQRRARQARRGGAALDALEALERGLVMGHAPAGLRATLDALQRDAEPSGDAGLDAVLHEIDIRLAVEAAKLDRHLEKA